MTHTTIHYHLYYVPNSFILIVLKQWNLRASVVRLFKISCSIPNQLTLLHAALHSSTLFPTIIHESDTNAINNS
jgi:hypothetical protein